MNLPSQGSYDLCPAVHAEENAIINSNRSDRIGATLYIAGFDRDGRYTMATPCQRCKRKIINSELEEVVIMDKNETPISFKVRDWIAEDSNWYVESLKKSKEGD